MKKKSWALLLSLVLVFGIVAEGSLAWLTATGEPVVNVFTDSDINIVLDESLHNDDGTLTTTTRVQGNSNYKMIPGHTIQKDPMVTLDKSSEACYLFVKAEEDLGSWSDNDSTKTFKDYLSYTVDTTIWTALPGVDNVYYKEVDTAELTAATEDPTYKIITNDTITVVGDNVTKAMMDEIDGVDRNGSTTTADAEAEIAARPTLTFKAAAVQLYRDQNNKFDVATAYAKVEWPATPTTPATPTPTP